MVRDLNHKTKLFRQKLLKQKAVHELQKNLATVKMEVTERYLEVFYVLKHLLQFHKLYVLFY